MQVVLDSLDLSQAERKLCAHALHQAGTIIEAASLLGITRHALKRRITKHRIAWPPPETQEIVSNAMNSSAREFAPRMPQNSPEPHLNRPPMRPNPGMVPQPMRSPNEPSHSHPYGHGHRPPPMEPNRVRPAPPHNPMPGIMGRPDLRKYDR